MVVAEAVALAEAVAEAVAVAYIVSDRRFRFRKNECAILPLPLRPPTVFHSLFYSPLPLSLSPSLFQAIYY